MTALCYIALLGQLLFFVYGLFALFVGFTVGLSSTSDLLVAFLLPTISGLSAILLFRAAPLFGKGNPS